MHNMHAYMQQIIFTNLKQVTELYAWTDMNQKDKK